MQNWINCSKLRFKLWLRTRRFVTLICKTTVPTDQDRFFVRRKRKSLVKLQNARKFAQPEIGNVVLGRNSSMKFNCGMNMLVWLWRSCVGGKNRSRDLTSSQQWIKLSVTRHVFFRSLTVLYYWTLSLTVRPLFGVIFLKNVYWNNPHILDELKQKIKNYILNATAETLHKVATNKGNQVEI